MSYVEYPRPKETKAPADVPIILSRVLLGLAIPLFLTALIIPIFAKAKYYSGPACISNVRQIAGGFGMYAADNDDALPNSAHWMDSIQTGGWKGERGLHDEQALGTKVYGYAMRDSASELRISKVDAPDRFIIDFDSNLLGRSAHSDLSTMPQPGRHHGRDNMGFLDGHSKSAVVK